MPAGLGLEGALAQGLLLLRAIGRRRCAPRREAATLENDASSLAAAGIPSP